ncbi:type II toxin-antitoxin system RelE/ParE family toxin [Anaerobaca lacustris]|jgi:toxin ParE1/3/4|uniref:Type II toxin-antitoxin system RelE/ParE family toxin n=1 Tax=Anaerobaca lacustris TaxID=3044600 RepID=A0AAW6TX27_9BACT|nr:type II toxin-antitoxin system RelE/ParE family toxin [Sedimentisphaerales bacterium M17dextr]MDI9431547.1 type II toxin-antitoxin system RelE/ParE family toxin [Planctomycetota bacterium]
MAELRWTEEAAIWLEDIYRYIAQDNPQAAHRVVTSIYEKVQMLRRFPRLGHAHRCEPEGEIRILLFGHYRIAYLIRTDGLIEILGVFHTALDIGRYL